MIKVTEIQKQCFILTDDRQDANDLADLFEHAYLHEKGLIRGSAMGRAKVTIFEYEQRQYVLRHYQRGGLIGKYINDRYIWAGLKNTRAYKEFEILVHLQALNLPSSPPLAARIKRTGLSYSADLITRYLPDTETLAERLVANTTIPWQAIGSTIALFHKQQVYHDDLNAHNILINRSDEIFIIDFDKGKIAGGDSWKQINLERLKRSLHKITDITEHDNTWQLVIEGYNKASAQNT